MGSESVGAATEGCVVFEIAHELHAAEDGSDELHDRWSWWEAPQEVLEPPILVAGQSADSIFVALGGSLARPVELAPIASLSDTLEYSQVPKERISAALTSLAADAAQRTLPSTKRDLLAVAKRVVRKGDSFSERGTFGWRFAFLADHEGRPGIVIVEHVFSEVDPSGNDEQALLDYVRSSLRLPESLEFSTWVAFPAEAAEAVSRLSLVRPGVRGVAVALPLDPALDDTRSVDVFPPKPLHLRHPRWLPEDEMSNAPLWQVLDRPEPGELPIVIERFGPTGDVALVRLSPLTPLAEAIGGASWAMHDEDLACHHRERSYWGVFVLGAQQSLPVVEAVLRQRHCTAGRFPDPQIVSVVRDGDLTLYTFHAPFLD